MGGGASAMVIPEDGVDKEAAKNHLGDAFDEAKFDELAADGKLTRAQVHQHHEAAPMNNSALVFVKPHANTEATRNYVKETLTAKGCHILAEGEIIGAEIDEKKLIDQHYYAIASKATILKPEEYFKPEVSGAKFQEEFGESWDTVKCEDRVFNAMDACAKFECNAEELEVAWRAAKVVKFGGGYYCGLVTVDDKSPLYVFNAFFMNMRNNFVGEGKSIYFYSIEWKSADMSWKDFRGNLIGATDPSKAPADSIRGTIAAKWEEFGLAAACDGGNNGVHASASPLEGLAEKMNWLKKTTHDEAFGSALVKGGVSEETIKEWCVDCQVVTEVSDNEPVYGGIFDNLEDLNVEECLEKCLKINTDTQAARPK